jgi:hypothetical protein
MSAHCRHVGLNVVPSVPLSLVFSIFAIIRVPAGSGLLQPSHLPSCCILSRYILLSPVIRTLDLMSINLSFIEFFPVTFPFRQFALIMQTTGTISANSSIGLVIAHFTFNVSRTRICGRVFSNRRHLRNHPVERQGRKRDDRQPAFRFVRLP